MLYIEVEQNGKELRLGFHDRPTNSSMAFEEFCGMYFGRGFTVDEYYDFPGRPHFNTAIIEFIEKYLYEGLE